MNDINLHDLMTKGQIIQQLITNEIWYRYNGVYYLVWNSDEIRMTTSALRTFGDYAYVIPLMVHDHNTGIVTTSNELIYQSQVQSFSTILVYKGIVKLLQNCSINDVECYNDGLIIYNSDRGLSSTLLHFEPVTSNLEFVMSSDKIYRMSDDKIAILSGRIYWVGTITQVQSPTGEMNISIYKEPVSSMEISVIDGVLCTIVPGKGPTPVV